MRNKAIFLDRDGVLNKLVFNPMTNEYESPHSVKDLVLFPWVKKSLQQLQDNNFILFLISNQPSYAKGKTSLEEIKLIHACLQKEIETWGINFKEYFYCYHHPNGIIAEYTYDCKCRKPKPYFLQKAISDYNINTELSWMVGDCDSDIYCAQAASKDLKTILVLEEFSVKKQGQSKPDFQVLNLVEAANIITKS